MIAGLVAKRGNKRRTRLIYITELAYILARDSEVIRVWERHRQIPDHLRAAHRSSSSFNGVRVWEHRQVFGEDGIIMWIQETGRRPGRWVPHPTKQGKFVRNAVKPKYIDGRNARRIVTMIDKGMSLEEIILKLRPQFPHKTTKAFEIALEDAALYFGFDLPRASEESRKADGLIVIPKRRKKRPPRKRKRKRKPTTDKGLDRELKALERRASSLMVRSKKKAVN